MHALRRHVRLASLKFSLLRLINIADFIVHCFVRTSVTGAVECMGVQSHLFTYLLSAKIVSSLSVTMRCFSQSRCVYA